jgi:glycine oxidase
VEVSAGIAAEDFDIRGGRIEAVRTTAGRLTAGSVVVTAGSWTGLLLARLGCRPAIKPIRGQIVLLSTTRPLITRIVNEGPRYLVPRPDGRLLAGSTEEDVGFDRGTTSAGVEGLLRLAISLVPALAEAQFERAWAGLRPSTRDGLPYLGRVPGVENLLLAAGHFRSGLQLSTGTAAVMAQLVRGESPSVDLAPFRLDRD